MAEPKNDFDLYESSMFDIKEYFEENACQREKPYHTKGGPASYEMIVLDDGHADGGVARCDQYVDGTVVQDA